MFVSNMLTRFSHNKLCIECIQVQFINVFQFQTIILLPSLCLLSAHLPVMKLFGLEAVLRIWDVYAGSRIRLFSIQDPGSELSPSRIPGPGSASKNLSILTPKKPKKWFLSSRKCDPGCSSRIRMLTFYPSRIPDPGVKRAPDPGSGSATLFGSINKSKFQKVSSQKDNEKMQ